MNNDILKYITMLQIALPNTGCLYTTFDSFEGKRSQPSSINHSIKTISSPTFEFKSTDNQSNFKANISRIKEQILNNLFISTIEKFILDIVRLNDFIKANQSDAVNMFSKSILEIADLAPYNLVVSLTSSHSIYFRFNNDKGLETHLEVFYSNEDEDTNDQIEAVVSVYQNESVKLKKFGTLKSVFESIKRVVKSDNYTFNSILYSNTSNTSTFYTV